ncbi:DUF881 domain-containing protein [Clostridium formicaceticum]|uniref:DUF881 domain-containing protein n=1 Tax=Clostridium formicaceticum TaxID=1497 RepID=A0AAC9RLA2_9CLOT|nr:DUF881 domain-containing protein [Clostridium formicaceticum]AOY75993.1 hypothetical protein BJL90_08835 [Clostridium formicaceticum]ARE86345.1 hypothetical protein CLFO_06670 [Clostridium formicaceticum]
MKKSNISFILFLAFAISGIIIGIHIDALGDIQNEISLPFSGEIEVQEVVDLRKANEDMKIKIKELKAQVEEYEEEKATENIVLKNLRSRINEYRILAGYEALAGPGIKITLESNLEENIAMTVEQKKYLINLVNELKAAGAEVISINNHRVASRSEVTLAGNHININMTAIAPPYVIRAIGDVEGFHRYASYRTLLFELMEGDGINTTIEFEEDIKVPALSKEKPMEFYTIVEEANPQ